MAVAADLGSKYVTVDREAMNSQNGLLAKTKACCGQFVITNDQLA